MIDVLGRVKGDVLWVIDIIGPETNFAPKKVFFDSLESVGSTKLVYVLENDKKICYPTRVLFDDFTEAELCSAIAFIKSHNNEDMGFEVSQEQLKKILSRAVEITEKYESVYPDKFLYHWMNYVS